MMRVDLLHHLRDFGTHAETVFEIAGGIEMQDLNGDRATLVLSSSYSPTASSIFLIRLAGGAVLDVHGVRNCLQLATHLSQ